MWIKTKDGSLVNLETGTKVDNEDGRIVASFEGGMYSVNLGKYENGEAEKVMDNLASKLTLIRMEG